MGQATNTSHTGSDTLARLSFQLGCLRPRVRPATTLLTTIHHPYEATMATPVLEQTSSRSSSGLAQRNNGGELEKGTHAHHEHAPALQPMLTPGMSPPFALLLPQMRCYC